MSLLPLSTCERSSNLAGCRALDRDAQALSTRPAKAPAELQAHFVRAGGQAPCQLPVELWARIGGSLLAASVLDLQRLFPPAGDPVQDVLWVCLAVLDAARDIAAFSLCSKGCHAAGLQSWAALDSALDTHASLLASVHWVPPESSPQLGSLDCWGEAVSSPCACKVAELRVLCRTLGISVSGTARHFLLALWSLLTYSALQGPRIS